MSFLLGFVLNFGVWGVSGIALGWYLPDLQFALFGIGCFVIIAFVLLYGATDDYRYNKLVDQHKKPYRLPFRKRWGGWELYQSGSCSGPYTMREYFYDRRFGRGVWMTGYGGPI